MVRNEKWSILVTALFQAECSEQVFPELWKNKTWVLKDQQIVALFQQLLFLFLFTHLDLNLCALELEDNLQDETARSVKCRVSEPQMSASNVSAGLIVVYSVCCCWCWEDNLSSYMLCNATCPNLQFVCLHFKVCFFFCCCFCCCCCCCIFISTTAAAALQTTPSS